jgi:membrane protein YdbS with pleckstrin-like domain
MEETIEDLISPDEKILWKGKRNDKMLNFYLISGLIITIALSLFFFSQGSVEHFLGREQSTSGSSIASVIILIGFVVSFSIYYNKQASAYVITERKIIVQHGWVPKSPSYAYHDQIRHMDISYGLMGHFFNVGTIYIDSGKIVTSEMKRKEIRGLNMNPSKPTIIYDAMKDIENPKKVYNLIERMIEKSKGINQKAELDEKQKDAK